MEDGGDSGPNAGKVEEASSQGTRLSFRRWKRQGDRLSLRSSRGNAALPAPWLEPGEIRFRLPPPELQGSNFVLCEPPGLLDSWVTPFFVSRCGPDSCFFLLLGHSGSPLRPPMGGTGQGGQQAVDSAAVCRPFCSRRPSRPEGTCLRLGQGRDPVGSAPSAP